ncbi:bifunctional diguanylate cyclase/phosphodiesterase [Sapientia aquatica]|uniref:EAL domain-containing protein n=1 Tax=Sapientia aquatica TaxID=1549640 RepID=A0A4R5W0F4_9BURK|nr:EAL domain-containing protein [Sapientia aquatica]TDK65485.1 EAL domain-containing protein [Sapientia aquatica]
MSMYRQIWLSLLLTAALSLAGGLLASTYSARGYLEDQLRIKNSDNAASLALSLGQHGQDPVDIKLAVAAMFDNGHYELIRVVDPHGVEVVARKANTEIYDAPMWFVNLVPLRSLPGEAQISNGWNQVGKVTIISNTRFAYRTLWESTLAMVGALFFSSFLGGWLGTLVLRRLKKTLNEVIAQAQAITEHHFITTPESNVPELRQLTSAMNTTVLLLKKMFAEEAIRLERVRLEANSDSLTGLANRSYFMAQLQALFEMEDANSGTLLLIRIANLADINKRLGRSQTDEMLKAVAAVLLRATEKIPNALSARLNGADFGVLLPLTEQHPISDQLLEQLVVGTSAYIQQGTVAYIGAGQFSYGLNSANLLSQVDSALAAAEAQGINCIRDAGVVVNADAPRSNEQWLRLLYQAIENRETKLGAFPVTDFNQQLVHSECPLRMRVAGEWLPAGRFFPVAERLGLSSTMDTTALTLGIEELNANRQIAGLAINLSARSLEDETFCNYVRTMLLANPKASKRLWIEFPEYGAFAHIAAFTEFVRQMKETGCKVGLEHFGRQFSQIGLLQELKLDYLKVDASFIRDIAHNSGNQVFLKGLISIGHNLGMQIFAEGVTEQAEMSTLEQLGFDGATGPGVKIASFENKV